MERVVMVKFPSVWYAQAKITLGDGMKKVTILLVALSLTSLAMADFVDPEELKKDQQSEYQKEKNDYIASLKGKELWFDKDCLSTHYDRFKMYSEWPTGKYDHDSKLKYYIPDNKYEKILIEDLMIIPDHGGYETRYQYKLRLPNGQAAYIKSDGYVWGGIEIEDPARFDMGLGCWTAVDPIEYRKKREALEAVQAKLAAKNKKPGVRIGMTKNQVLTKTSWGKPDDINKTTDRTGTFEQWIYGDENYLYFKNGILVSIQN